MTSDTPDTPDSGDDPDAKGRPVAAGASSETQTAVAQNAGDDETALVPHATAAVPEHAWSEYEPGSEVESRPWRSVWVMAGVGLVCAVVVAFAIFGVHAMLRGNRSAPQANPYPPTHSSAPAPARTAAPGPPTPVAARPDDDEFVALALSPRSIGGIGGSHVGGFGTSGTQAHANEIALSECRAGTGNDDCITVTAGMFHGCVSWAVDTVSREWSGGTGADAATARAAALARLGNPAAWTFVQCSDPPGQIRSPAAATPPAAKAPPSPAPPGNAAPAGPPMAHGAVLGSPCNPTGPTFGYTADGSVLACPSFGHWVQTANWSGVHEIGSPCTEGPGSAVSPNGAGLVCVTAVSGGSSTWQPGP